MIFFLVLLNNSEVSDANFVGKSQACGDVEVYCESRIEFTWNAITVCLVLSMFQRTDRKDSFSKQSDAISVKFSIKVLFRQTQYST